MTTCRPRVASGLQHELGLRGKAPSSERLRTCDSCRLLVGTTLATPTVRFLGRSIEKEHGELGHDTVRSSAAVSCRCALRRAPDVTPDNVTPTTQTWAAGGSAGGLSRPTWDPDRGGPDRGAGSAPLAVPRRPRPFPPLIADRRRGELPAAPQRSRAPESTARRSRLTSIGWISRSCWSRNLTCPLFGRRPR
jgi:hypothetical protein